MFLNKELKKLASLALEGFKSKTNANLTLEDLEWRLKRPGLKGIALLEVGTKRASDNLRFQFNILSFVKTTSVTNFTLKIKPNTLAGDLSNEVYAADINLAIEDYIYIYTYLNSPGFKALVASDPILLTQSGDTVYLQNGLPLFTHL